MKKIKLNLDNLKVESIVTDLEKSNVETVKGGTGGTLGCSIDINCDLSGAGGPWCSAYCSDILCPATFGTGGICDGPAPTRGNESVCICA